MFISHVDTAESCHVSQWMSYISSIDHLVMREFVSGPPRYHLAIKGIRE